MYDIIHAIIIIAVGIAIWFLAPYARRDPLVLVLKIIGAVVVIIGAIILVSNLVGYPV